jgi:hypothetical protein
MLSKKPLENEDNPSVEMIAYGERKPETLNANRKARGYGK